MSVATFATSSTVYLADPAAGSQSLDVKSYLLGGTGQCQNQGFPPRVTVAMVAVPIVDLSTLFTLPLSGALR